MEALGRIFRVTLELLVAYKDQVAGLSLPPLISMICLQCVSGGMEATFMIIFA